MTTSNIFTRFVDKVCSNIKEVPAIGNVDDKYVFMWDNLWSHCTNQVHQRVIFCLGSMGRFEIVHCPP